jgi:hypothetical protein
MNAKLRLLGFDTIQSDCDALTATGWASKLDWDASFGQPWCCDCVVVGGNTTCSGVVLASGCGGGRIPTIECAGGRVTGLFLSNCGVTGALPGSLRDGPVPGVTPGLTALVNLDLGQNLIAGDLSVLSTLTSLQFLGLSFNQFEGSLNPLRRLTRLVRLKLNGLKLTGTMDPLRNLTALYELRVFSNQLQGSLDAVSGLTMLRTLDVSTNSFVGSLSPLTQLTRLNMLDVSANALQGSLAPLSLMTAITNIDLAHNKFTETVQPLTSCQALQFLVLSDNRLDGTACALCILLILACVHMCVFVSIHGIDLGGSCCELNSSRDGVSVCCIDGAVEPRAGDECFRWRSGVPCHLDTLAGYRFRWQSIVRHVGRSGCFVANDCIDCVVQQVYRISVVFSQVDAAAIP